VSKQLATLKNHCTETMWYVGLQTARSFQMIMEV